MLKTPKKQKSHEEKSRSRQSPTEKSSATLSHEHNVNLEANKLGTVVAQACLSVARIMKVVEDTYNLKVAESLCQGNRLGNGRNPG